MTTLKLDDCRFYLTPIRNESIVAVEWLEGHFHIVYPKDGTMAGPYDARHCASDCMSRRYLSVTTGLPVLPHVTADRVLEAVELLLRTGLGTTPGTNQGPPDFGRQRLSLNERAFLADPPLSYHMATEYRSASGYLGYAMRRGQADAKASVPRYATYIDPRSERIMSFATWERKVVKIGDFILVDDEGVRISAIVTGSRPLGEVVEYMRLSTSPGRRIPWISDVVESTAVSMCTFISRGYKEVR